MGITHGYYPLFVTSDILDLIIRTAFECKNVLGDRSRNCKRDLHTHQRCKEVDDDTDTRYRWIRSACVALTKPIREGLQQYEVGVRLLLEHRRP